MAEVEKEVKKERRRKEAKKGAKLPRQLAVICHQDSTARKVSQRNDSGSDERAWPEELDASSDVEEDRDQLIDHGSC